MYKSVFKFGTNEFTEKKSVFIGFAKPVKTEEEAISFIEEIKSQNKDATHNCYAYILGENFNIQRFSDDGEPSGTAGIPILEVLKKEEITNVAVVVTRYFGGTLLGAGGLIRAYTKASKIAIDDAVRVDILEYQSFSAKFDYGYQGKIANYLSKNEIEIKEMEYSDKVCTDLILDIRNIETVKNDLNEITSANIEFKAGEKLFLPTVNGKIFKG